MEVDDFEGHTTITAGAELDHRLRRVRRGDYGAFILSHEMKGSSLWIHVFKDIAYLHYFPDGDGEHPGYQATGMQPANCDERVRFLMVGDSIEMPRETLVTLEAAYLAASEYLHDSGLPASVLWTELRTSAPTPRPAEHDAVSDDASCTAPQSDYPGVWRHRSILVALQEAPLPPICLKSGQPATQWLPREMQWRDPWHFMVPWIVKLAFSEFNTKRTTLMIGLSDEWASRHGTRAMTAYVVGGVGIATGLAGCILNGVLGNAGWPLLLLPLAFVVIAGAAIYGHFACRLVWPERITDKYVFLKGVHPSVLDQLPEWLDYLPTSQAPAPNSPKD